MNLSEILSNVKAELNSATNIDTLIKRWANQAQKKFVSISKHDFSWLALTELTLTTVSGQKEYALSPLVDNAKVILFTERTSPKRIFVTTRAQLLEMVPDLQDTPGDPEFAYHSGFTPVLNNPSSASVLSCVSTSASDTSIVKIEGLNGSGVYVGEEVTLTGTTPVSTVHSYTRILSRGINGFLAGTLTITSNGGLVTISVISPRDRQGMHPKIVFYPVPSSALTLYYDAYMRLPELVNNNDMSLIPEKYHEAIEHYCLYRGYRHKKDYQAAAEAKQAFEEVVMQAVVDDRGPQKKIVMQNYYPGFELSNGNLPGNYPRDF